MEGHVEGYYDFKKDGFLLVPNIIPPETVSLLRSRFEPLFAGDFETVRILFENTAPAHDDLKAFFALRGYTLTNGIGAKASGNFIKPIDCNFGSI